MQIFQPVLSYQICTELRELDILYDEDENGSALHFYSTNHGNGLFLSSLSGVRGTKDLGRASIQVTVSAGIKIEPTNGSVSFFDRQIPY